MPRVRFKMPIVVDVTDEELSAVRAVGDLVAKVKSSGLVQAVSEVLTTGKAAAQSVAGRRRRRRKR